MTLPGHILAFLSARLVFMRLTDEEGDYSTCKVDKSLEEVDDQLDDFGSKFGSELGSVLDEMQCGGEEGPDKLDHGRDKVGESVDDGRHGG
jgi:hypothetical protein